jgi:RNA polymerase sigma factor (sigma-70 family)
VAFPLSHLDPQDLDPELPTDSHQTSIKRHLQVIDPDAAIDAIDPFDAIRPQAIDSDAVDAEATDVIEQLTDPVEAADLSDTIDPVIDPVIEAASSAAGQRSARSAKVARLLDNLSTCTDPVRRLQIQEEVALATLPVARSIASRYRGRGVDVGDLEQIAALGLVKAVRRWKSGLSEDFLQYAVPTITGEIKRYFRDSWWTVRPPRRLQEARAAMAQAEQDLRQRSGQEPDEKALATELGLDIRTVRQAKEVRQSARPTSLEDPARSTGRWPTRTPNSGTPRNGSPCRPYCPLSVPATVPSSTCASTAAGRRPRSASTSASARCRCPGSCGTSSRRCASDGKPDRPVAPRRDSEALEALGRVFLLVRRFRNVDRFRRSRR